MQKKPGPTDEAASEHPLRAYRRKHGLSQDAIAQAAATTKATISRIEAGSLDPTMDLMRRLIAATRGRVTADELIAWSPPPQQQSPEAADEATT